MTPNGTKIAVLAALIALLCSTLPVFALQSDTDDDDQDSLEQLGIVGSGQYISPQFENLVAWDGDWEVDLSASSTDEQQLRDQLSLDYGDKATIVIMFIESGGEDLIAYAERLVRYRDVVDPAATMVWAGSSEDGAVILYETDEAGWHIASLVEIRAVDDEGTIQVVELLLYPEYAEEVFASAQTDVQVDSGTPFQLVSEFPKEFLGNGEFEAGLDNEIEEPDKAD